MALALYILCLVLTSVAPFFVYGSGFRCKATAGCEIARCDPSPFSRGLMERNEFPIICVSDGVDDNNDEEYVKELKEEIRRLWYVNGIQGDELKRVKEVSEELQEKNKNLEKEMKKLEKQFKKLTAKLTDEDHTKTDDNKSEIDDKEKNKQKDETTTDLGRTIENKWKEWSIWSPCTLSCGDGVNTRSRMCLRNYRAMHPEEICEELQSRLCYREPCVARTAECRSDEFRYNDVCYWTKIHRKNNVTFGQAEAICKTRNSMLAYPVDKTHYELIMIKAREEIPTYLSRVGLWTGIRQNPMTEKLSVPGERLFYAKWRSGQPSRDPVETHVFLWVNSNDKSDQSNGLMDGDPAWLLYGAVCMYNNKT